MVISLPYKAEYGRILNKLKKSFRKNNNLQIIKKRETSRWSFYTTTVERSKFTFYPYLVSALMFPTVLDVNNIHCFILVRSIAIISFYVIKTTLKTNKSLWGVISWVLSVVLSNHEEKLKLSQITDNHQTSSCKCIFQKSNISPIIIKHHPVNP